MRWDGLLRSSLLIGAACWTLSACATGSTTSSGTPGSRSAAGPGGGSRTGGSIDQAAIDFDAQVAAIKEKTGDGAPDFGDVAARMEFVVQKHPRYALAWYNLGVAYEETGRSKEAENAYTRAFEANAAPMEFGVNAYTSTPLAPLTPSGLRIVR